MHPRIATSAIMLALILAAAPWPTVGQSAAPRTAAVVAGTGGCAGDDVAALTAFFLHLEEKVAHERGVPASDDPVNRRCALLAARALAIPVPMGWISRPRTSLARIAGVTLAPLGAGERRDVDRAVKLYDARFQRDAATWQRPPVRAAGRQLAGAASSPAAARGAGLPSSTEGGSSAVRGSPVRGSATRDAASRDSASPDTSVQEPPAPPTLPASIQALRSLHQSGLVMRNGAGAVPRSVVAQRASAATGEARRGSVAAIILRAPPPSLTHGRDDDADVPEAVDVARSALPLRASTARAAPTRAAMTRSAGLVTVLAATPAADTSAAWRRADQDEEDEASIEVCRLGKGDVLRVTWHELPDAAGRPTCQSNTCLISVAGTLDEPGLGLLRAEGLTPLQVAQRLSAMAQRKDLPTHFTVQVQRLHGAKVYVLGAVGRAGVVTLDCPALDLADLVESIGGFAANADRHRVRVIRGHRRLTVDLAPPGAKEPPRFDILPGDRVFVPRQKAGTLAEMPVIDGRTGWILFGSPASP